MYPVCLHIADQLCVVLGGGKVAERKVRGLLKNRARVRLVSPDCTPALRDWADQGLLEWRQKRYEAADLVGSRLVFATTNNTRVQQAIVQDARKAGILINSADDPEACDFHLPASLRRGDLLLTVSTNGRSPALAAMIRQYLEADFGPEYALLTELMGRMRDLAKERHWSEEKKQKVFAALMEPDMRCWLKNGQTLTLPQRVRDLLGVDADRVDLDFPGAEEL